MTRDVLILAGTAEARAFTAAIVDLPGISPLASFAGATSHPAKLPIPTRMGGFGGVDGLTAFLKPLAAPILIDATHPYATRMQANAVAACNATGTPRLRLLRPPWPTRDGWVRVPDEAAAADALPPGAKVLLTSGRKEIAPFANRADLDLTLRTIEPVADLPGHIAPLLARPPFNERAERALLSQGFTHLVTKNAGGSGTAKLDAADALRLTTIVIDRPDPPPGQTVETADAAVAWLRHVVANGTPPSDGYGAA